MNIIHRSLIVPSYTYLRMIVGTADLVTNLPHIPKYESYLCMPVHVSGKGYLGFFCKYIRDAFRNRLSRISCYLHSTTTLHSNT